MLWSSRNGLLGSGECVRAFIAHAAGSALGGKGVAKQAAAHLQACTLCRQQHLLAAALFTAGNEEQRACSARACRHEPELSGLDGRSAFRREAWSSTKISAHFRGVRTLLPGTAG